MQRLLAQLRAQPMIGSPQVFLPSSWRFDGTGKAIYILGGTGNVPPLGGIFCSIQGMDNAIYGDHIRQWVDVGGYAVIVLPYNPHGWGGPDISDTTLGVFGKIYRALQPVAGGIGHAAVVGLVGYSMGGGGALNVAKRFGSGVVGPLLLVEPATDLDWAGGLVGGYTPGYSLAYTASPYNSNSTGTDPGPLTGAAAAIQAQYAIAMTTAGSLPGGVPAGAGTLFLTEPLPVNTPTTSAGGTATIGGLTVSWTGWTNSGVSNTGFALTGVGSSAGTTAASGTSFTPPWGSSSYATQAAGYRIRDEYTTWAGFHGLIVHCQDDQVVPAGQSDAFAAGAGANWSVLSPKPTGNHTAPLANVDVAVTLGWWQSRL